MAKNLQICPKKILFAGVSSVQILFDDGNFYTLYVNSIRSTFSENFESIGDSLHKLAK